MNRGLRRYIDKTHALRKKRISDNYPWCVLENSHYYNNLHQYSKNKIHCSCWLCRDKSYEHLTHSDLIKTMRLDEQLNSKE